MIVKTTHVGSLPFVDPEIALDFSLRFDIPALFTLPKADPKQYMGHDILSFTHNWSQFDIDSNLPYEDLFFKGLEKSKKQSFKCQLIGPVSFRKYFKPKEEINQIEEKLLNFYRIIISRLEKRGDLFFVLDEPGLENFEDILSLNLFIDQIKSDDFEVGVHCCGDIEEEIFGGLKLGLKQLDWSKRDRIYFPQSISFLAGIANKMSTNWGKLKFESENIIISPACGLANSTDPELEFQKLKNFQAFLQTR